MKPETTDNTFYFYRGRVALYALLQALDLKQGDEILLPGFTCLAVPSPIIALGARPVYLDIDKATYNLNPQHVERRITERTKAIIVQHTFGIPADMDTIKAVARHHNLAIIEDCCHVCGSTYKGTDVGCLGDAAFYSYEWGKPVVIGLGGAAVVHSEELCERVRALYETFVAPPVKDALLIHLQYVAHTMLRRPSLFWRIRDIYQGLSRWGMVIGTFRHEEFVGELNDEYPRRMARSLQTRLAGKLHNIHAMIAHRKWVTAQYETGLRELGLECIATTEGAQTVYLRYPLLAKDKVRVLREARRRKVELGDWFTAPIDPLTEDQWARVGYEKGSCPIAEDVCQHIVTLPIYSAVGPIEIERTLEFMRDIRDHDLI